MQTIHIYTDITPNRPGKYRIYKPFNNDTEVAFAEFEMVDNKGVRKLMDSMWKKVTSLPRTDTIRENISTACQLHDGDTISVGLINNAGWSDKQRHAVSGNVQKKNTELLRP